MSHRSRITRLIVNADDFGLSDPTNEGIVEAHVKGIVTSTSIMAVGDAFENAIRLAAGLPELDVGIHLTLVGERALLPAARIPTLVDDAGRLPADAYSFLRAYLGGRIRLVDVRAELGAQFDRARSAGLRLSHADSHQHLHVLGGIRGTVAELCSAHDVKTLRHPVERFGRHLWHGPIAPRRLTELAAIRLACGGKWPRDIQRTDAFFGFYAGGELSRDSLLRIIQRLPAGKVSELMCHPGRYDQSHKNWKYSWEDELAALTDPTVEDALAARNIELTRFSCLQR